MKATLEFLSLLLFSSICSHPLFVAAADPALDPVLDIDGNVVLTGVQYYILPVLRGFGGGLTASSFGNATCPLIVVQERQELARGLPLTFTPADNEGIVRVSTDLNIRFSAATICIESNVWKPEYDETIGKYIIVTNGVEGNPGPKTLSSWFKIEKYLDFYKLVFCPTVCSYCKDFGIFFQDGKRVLALTDGRPFLVMFKELGGISL